MLLRDGERRHVVVRTIPHRQLRNNSSAVLREVAQGEAIQITNNGEVVAILVPPGTEPPSTLRIRRAKDSRRVRRADTGQVGPSRPGVARRTPWRPVIA